MTLGSLFSGIDGLDLGFEQAGFSVAWQCEIDPYCRAVLRMHWPSTRIYNDVRNIADGAITPESVAILAGGDPCPARSNARGGRNSTHPDLAGYFLAVAGRLRPRWMVRENVPAPDVTHFVAGLECLGYAALVVEVNSAGFTGQHRMRQFCIGCPSRDAASSIERVLDQRAVDPSVADKSDQAATSFACLVAHHKRYHEGNDYIFEDTCRRLRVLTQDERARLQGFPAGWVGNASEYRAAQLYGNAVTVPVARYMAELILQAEAQR